MTFHAVVFHNKKTRETDISSAGSPLQSFSLSLEFRIRLANWITLMFTFCLLSSDQRKDFPS